MSDFVFCHVLSVYNMGQKKGPNSLESIRAVLILFSSSRFAESLCVGSPSKHDTNLNIILINTIGCKKNTHRSGYLFVNEKRVQP